MRSLLVSVLLCLLASSLSHAQDARPPILWVKEYFPDRIANFMHVIPTSDGGFAVAAVVPGSYGNNRPVIKFDSEGNMLWYSGTPYYAQSGFWVEELADSGFIATGGAKLAAGESSGLFLVRIAADGEMLWSKCYDRTENDERGGCCIALPDGGFAVCGYTDDYSPWLLRTDSEGDTLWTRLWEGSGTRGRRVVYYDDGLTMYVCGSAGHPWLVRYSMDGDFLWEQDYTTGGSSSEFGGTMCLASDLGYAIATAGESELIHTDWSGQEEWREEITGASGRLGLSLDPTMDGGYIFSGWGGYWGPPDASAELHSAPADTGLHRDGWLVKMDSLGQSQWVFYNCLGDRQNYFNCARQLPQGGYIVGGQIWDLENSDWNGYLIRLAPETGIEEGEPSALSTLSASPNPFSSAVEISFSLTEPLQVRLSVYDLAGRRMDDLWVGSSPAGEHALTWPPGSSIPAGCYLVVLDTPDERQVRRVVRL